MYKDKYYMQIVNEAPFGFVFHDIIVDENVKPFNYRFPEVHEAFENPTNFIRNTQVIHGIQKAVSGLTSDLRKVFNPANIRRLSL